MASTISARFSTLAQTLVPLVLLVVPSVGFLTRSRVSAMSRVSAPLRCRARSALHLPPPGPVGGWEH